MLGQNQTQSYLLSLLMTVIKKFKLLSLFILKAFFNHCFIDGVYNDSSEHWPKIERIFVYVTLIVTNFDLQLSDVFITK